MKKITSALFMVLLIVNAFGSGHTVTITSTNPTCNGSCDGTATATVSGGVGPFEYSWASPLGFSSFSQNIVGLCMETYTVTVTDNSDMSVATAYVDILEPPSIIVSISSPPTICFGVCEVISSNVIGGTPGYTYSWTPNIFLSSSVVANPVVCPATTQTYTLAVTDMNGCITTASTTIFVDQMFVSTTSTNTSSCSACDGTSTVNVIGGNPPYSYFWGWGNPQTTATATNLCIGGDTVTITDAMGCISAEVAVVSNGGSGVIIVLDTLININCSGSSFGTIAVHATGGIPPYNYYLNGFAPMVNGYFSGLSAGTYSLTVYDSSYNCYSSGNYTIQNFANLYASLTSTIANCGSTGSSTVIASGAHPPYTYQWNDTLNQTTATATNLSGGHYTVLITDSIGCSISASATIYSDCYNIIKGRVYNDVNGNCVFDGSDTGIQGRTVYVTGDTNQYGYTDANGDYTIFTGVLTNTLTHNIPQYANIICPSSNQISANFVSMGDTISGLDFADQYIANVNDLQISYYPGTARPGFQQTGYLYYQNIGLSPLTGVTINLSHDSILTYNYSAIPSTSYTYPNIGWNIGTLIPGQTGYISTYFTVPLITNGGNLGRTLNYHAQINPVIGDTTPANNIANSSTIITGSWDPNLKSVTPAGTILATDSLLHYTIQFQNTGTDTAFTIVLKDTLSPYLDPSTVETGIASHPFTFNIAFNGELTWTFNNILLADSTKNEPESHGFATFTVKQKANNPIGTQIENTASIYFDFNPAVVTNTVSNEIVDVTTGIKSTSTNNVVSVYPNPFSDNTTFIIQSDKSTESYSFEMTDVLGKKVKSINEITNEQFEISRAGLQNGIYFYKIYSSENVVGIGKLIVK